jgi:pyruvate-formate lyase-activating enzyme
MRNLADYLYELNLLVSIHVFMDPDNFEECEEIVDFFKESRRDFPLYVKPVLPDVDTKYNEKQTVYLADNLKQIPDGEWLEYVSIGKWKILFNSPNN